MTDPALPTSTEAKFNEVMAAINEFIANEGELAKAEIKPAVKNAGIGSGAFAAAGTLAFHALWMLVIALALAIGWAFTAFTVLSPWASFTLGFVIAALISLFLGFICFKVGQSFMKKVKKPEATIAEAKASLQTIAQSLGRIKESVDSGAVITVDDDEWRRPAPAADQDAWRRPSRA